MNIRQNPDRVTILEEITTIIDNNIYWFFCSVKYFIEAKV